jgi:intermediate cleaving peptidase 55
VTRRSKRLIDGPSWKSDARTSTEKVVKVLDTSTISFHHNHPSAISGLHVQLSMSLRRTICQHLPRWVEATIPRRARLPVTLYPRTQTHTPRSYSTITPTTTIDASAYSFGQPVHETHPHLLRPGELTPGITAQEYFDRRNALAASLPAESIAIIPSATTIFRTGNVFYPFHQSPDFLYLTGFNEPDACAIIRPDGSDSGEHIFHLYVREKDAKSEQWDGARSGTLAARDVWNADIVGDIADFCKLLPDIVRGAQEVYTDLLAQKKGGLGWLLGTRNKSEGAIAEMIPERKVRTLRPLMNNLRIFKSPAEVACMREAGRASGLAHTDAMRAAVGGAFKTERELRAFLDWRQVYHGCEGSAFEPVVAGGRNAMSIHYVRNDDVLRQGEMVLVDGGGTWGGYVSDITRTFPLDGKFTDAQRDLYQVVLNVQRSCVSLCRGSAEVSLDKLHLIAEEQLKDGLKGIGFDVSGKAVERLFPHHLSHYLGLDVHDTGGYSRKTVLREGHCVTVEPGVYIPDEEEWPRHFRGVGIRIEDSVAVHEDNCTILTAEAVKEVEGIERLRDY